MSKQVVEILMEKNINFWNSVSSLSVFSGSLHRCTNLVTEGFYISHVQGDEGVAEGVLCVSHSISHEKMKCGWITQTTCLNLPKYDSYFFFS